jgi:hypothetical protein
MNRKHQGKCMSYFVKELWGEPMTLSNSVSVKKLYKTKRDEKALAGQKVLVKMSRNRRDKSFRGYTGTAIERGGGITGVSELYRNHKCSTWRISWRKE